MSKGRFSAVGLVVSLCAVIGFLLPQHFSGVKKLQSLFIQADDQLASNDTCSAIAHGVFPAVAASTPQECSSIFRVRDAYEGLSYPEAKKSFQLDIFRDQAVFSAIAAGLCLISYLFLYLLSSIKDVRRLRLRDTARINRLK
jgi:hypothetical protein